MTVPYEQDERFAGLVEPPGVVAPARSDGLALPHSVDAEREVLSTVFIDATLLGDIRSRLGGPDFYVERFRLVYGAMCELADTGAAVDFVLVQEHLRSQGALEKAGGTRTLSELLDRAGKVSNLGHYCARVAELAERRRIIESARRIEALAFDESTTNEELRGSAATAMDDAFDQRTSRGPRRYEDYVRQAVDEAEAAYDRGDEMIGLVTGQKSLDEVAQGFGPGDLVIVAGRPAMGKSALAGGWLDQWGLEGRRGAFFQLEMPGSQLAARSIARIGKLSLSASRKGRMSGEQWPRYMEAANRAKKFDVYVDETGSIEMHRVRSVCQRLHRAKPLDFIMLDYLQLMQTDNRSNRNLATEIGKNSGALKGLAKDLGCPAVVLAQLSRDCEKRTDKRPMLSDLRDSGAIEQDADKVLFVFRPEKYHADPPQEIRGLAEVIVAKHRNGPTGIAKLRFVEEQTRFEDWDGGAW